MSERLSMPEYESDLRNKLVLSYLELGSAEKAMNKFSDCGISLPELHRELNKRGIIKAVGPNKRFSETLFFFSRLISEKIPLETLYRRLWKDLESSSVTFHRILQHIRKGLMRRSATAVVITPEGDPCVALVGRDISTPRPEVGKPYGSLTVPACFSSMKEPTQKSVLRVLQQEAFSDLAVKGKLPVEIIPVEISPFMYVNITDVKVSVFHIQIPYSYFQNFSSPKLSELHFKPIAEIISDNGQLLRAGMREIGVGYWNLLANKEGYKPSIWESELNRGLALLPVTETVPNY